MHEKTEFGNNIYHKFLKWNGSEAIKYLKKIETWKGLTDASFIEVEKETPNTYSHYQFLWYKVTSSRHIVI